MRLAGKDRTLYYAAFLFPQVNNEIDMGGGVRSAGLAAAQWLSLRLQVLAASVITLVAGLGVAGAAGLLPSFASQAGGCVTFPLPLEKELTIRNTHSGNDKPWLLYNSVIMSCSTPGLKLPQGGSAASVMHFQSGVCSLQASSASIGQGQCKAILGTRLYWGPSMYY